MVGLNGLEPSTSALSEQRSNQLSYRPINGGDKGARTLDPLRARQVLSQAELYPHMVDLQGLEPRTDRL